MSGKFRIGFGYDLHKIREGSRGLWIGGCRISDTLEFVAHSDGDILIHALIDSLLGATGEIDIGQLFPEDDEQYTDISSLKLLAKTLKIMEEYQAEICNIDAVVVAEKIKIAPYKNSIRELLSRQLGIDLRQFNLKAKTREGTGAVGRGEAMECYCTSLITLVPRDHG